MAKIPIILEPGRADGKLATSGVIFDENKNEFQSQINKELENRLNDVKDTLESDSTNTPLSAKQGKVLKELINSIIHGIEIPELEMGVDTIPTKNNNTNVVTSAGIYTAIENALKEVSITLAKSLQEGFTIVDSKGNIAIKYDETGFDVAILSPHIITLLENLQVILSLEEKNKELTTFTTNISNELSILYKDVNIYKEQTDKDLFYAKNKIYQSINEGFYLTDANNNIVLSYTEKGFNVAQINNHVKELFGQYSSEEEGFYLIDDANNVIIKIDNQGIDISKLSLDFITRQGLPCKIIEDGLYFTDYKNNICAKITNDGFEFINNNNNNTTTITLENSDKICIFGDSYTDGYGMLFKHWIDQLSMHTDYQFKGYGVSGHTASAQIYDITKDIKHRSDLSIRSWNITYGLIEMGANEGANLSANPEIVARSWMNLANAIKSLGATPIFISNHYRQSVNTIYNRMFNDYGYKYWNWSYQSDRYWHANPLFKPFWYNSNHESTRTFNLWYNGLAPYIATLPIPKQSIKLFRARTTDSIISNFNYDTMNERNNLFYELHSGINAWTAATEDNFDLTNQGTVAIETYKDEYDCISIGKPVFFGNKALIEIITPFVDLKNFIINVIATGVNKAYIRKINSIAINPTKSISFKLSSSDIAKLHVGDVLTLTEYTACMDPRMIGKQFTIGAINENYVVTTTNAGLYTLSTEDRITAICNTNTVSIIGSYTYPSADVINNSLKPLCEWKEIKYNNNKIIVQDITDYLEYDKVTVLLEGNDITISSINSTMIGLKEKNRESKALIEKKPGTKLFSKNFNEDLTSWNNYSSLIEYIPVTDKDGMSEPLPYGINKVMTLPKNTQIKQTFNDSSLNEDWTSSTIQIRILARYFPKYIKNPADFPTSEITRTSYDFANLIVKCLNNYPCAKLEIGTWWNEYIVELNTCGSSYNHTISLLTENKDIQLALVEIVKL